MARDDLVKNLTDIQKDALKEIGNIGAGNAATAFAQFLDCKIDMTVPTAEVLSITDVPEVTGSVDEDVISILLQAMGEAPASLLFILSEASAKHLLNIILNKEIDLNNIEEIEISALKEIGNILSGSYLSALNKLTGFNLIQSVPGFAYDMAGAVISSSMIPFSEASDYTLLIETKFLDGDHEIEGYFLLIPHTGSLKKILSALGFDT